MKFTGLDMQPDRFLIAVCICVTISQIKRKAVSFIPFLFPSSNLLIFVKSHDLLFINV